MTPSPTIPTLSKVVASIATDYKTLETRKSGPRDARVKPRPAARGEEAHELTADQTVECLFNMSDSSTLRSFISSTTIESNRTLTESSNTVPRGARGS